jgi:outer membrane cobalamin receptor
LGEVLIQTDSLQKKSYPNIIYHEFSEKEIQNSVYSDLGSMVNTISNVTLKDYGGVGGLKTISVRGFSSEHNAVLIANIPISNSQTGAVDLGNFRTDNIAQMSFSVGTINNKFHTAKANSYVSTLNIKPRELKTNINKLSVFASGSYGSFNTVEPFLGVNGRVGKSTFLGGNFRYLYSDGNYPYTYETSTGTEEADRQNSKVNSLQANFGGVHQFKKGAFDFRLSYSDGIKGLPGAVILYDSTESRQRLYTKNFSGQMNYKFEKDKWSAYAFGSYSYDYTNYQDPNFLNSTGGIDDRYWMNNYYFGSTFSITPINRFSMLFGFDETFTTLNSSKSTIQNTYRSDLKGMIGINYAFWRMKLKVNGIFTYLSDQNDGQRTFESIKVNPFISLGIYPIKKSLFHIRLYYKNSLRPPTMNEMYYNQIIKDLEPETAHQINFGMSYKITTWNFFEYFHVGMDFYKNFVKNKIVLIPTQNLFVWSVQNIGKTDITGLDFNISFRTSKKRSFQLFWDIKYSLLLALDVTDADSKTYKNQLPYIPKDNFTTLFGFEFYGFGFSWNINYGGTRYALSENIEANKMEDYFLNDMSIYYTYKTKNEKHSLKIKLDLRNVFNVDYQMVNSFPMPGINYNVKLIYELDY